MWLWAASSGVGSKWRQVAMHQPWGEPGTGSVTSKGRTRCDLKPYLSFIQCLDPLKNLCSFSSSHLLGLPGLMGFSPLAAQAAHVIWCESNWEAVWGVPGAVAVVKR